MTQSLDRLWCRKAEWKFVRTVMPVQDFEGTPSDGFNLTQYKIPIIRSGAFAPEAIGCSLDIGI